MLDSTSPSFFKDHFLVATPRLQDGLFGHSIAYLCEHDEEGAMGIVVNRPLELKLVDMLDHLELETELIGDELVMAGGPVSIERGFVLHRDDGRQWDSSLDLRPGIKLTSSVDIMQAIARNEGPRDRVVLLGYSGWGPGQLEQEIQDNAWLTLPADDPILFDTPHEKRVDAALEKLGISFAQLSSIAGHA